MKTSLLAVLVTLMTFCEPVTSQVPDNDIEEFMNFAVNLLKEDLSQNSKTAMKKRSTVTDNPGFYAMPLPPLPTDVKNNLSRMKMVNNVNMDLVSLQYHDKRLFQSLV